MIVASPPESAISPGFYEGALTILIIGLAYAFPRLGWTWFARVEKAFSNLARRRSWAVAFVGFAAFLLRLAILPFSPIPLPFVPDDFSFLLAGDTFAQGRLTNPTPAMWTHFESIHITMFPSYTSMYFPMTGLFLAAGKILTGHAWFGLLAATALMCAAICWMLQAWLPPGWALLGGVIAILRLGLFSYWINSYNGGGSVAALGGALVLGAFPRLMKTLRLRDGIWLAIGISILMLSRPYEGLLLCLPVAFVLSRWVLTGNNPFGRTRPSNKLFLRRAALPLVLLIATATWLAYYDYRAFGSTTTLPYTVDRTTYAIAPYFMWQHVRALPMYRHASLKLFYTVNEMTTVSQFRDNGGFWIASLGKVIMSFLFFAGFSLIPPMIMLPRVFLDRRIRFLIVGVLFLTAGMAIQIFFLPHYLAPFTAAFYAIGLQAMRHLRLWSPEKRPVGLALVRLAVVIVVLLAGMRLFPRQMHYSIQSSPPADWLLWWSGPGHFGTERARVEEQLRKLPGKQLVIVRYAPDHDGLNEWVYNDPDIDHAKIIWSQDMSPSENLELIHHYNDRQVFLVQPDTTPAILSNFRFDRQNPDPIPAEVTK